MAHPVRLLPALLVCAVCAAAGSRPAAEWLRREIERILAQPEYQRATPWLQKLLDWLEKLLRGWWGDEVFALKEAWPGLYWGIVILLLVALALLLTHILFTIHGAFRERSVRRGPIPRGKTIAPSELRAQAHALADIGRFPEALALLFEAVVRQLDRAGALRFDPAATNWEYAAALAAHPGLQREIRALAGELDLVWYGRSPVDAPAFRKCADQLDRAWEQAVALA